jgi:hypothetical protein
MKNPLLTKPEIVEDAFTLFRKTVRHGESPCYACVIEEAMSLERVERDHLFWRIGFSYALEMLAKASTTENK